MDLGLKGKVAIVTGPANPLGIGRAIALALAKEGCDIACLDIDYEGAAEAATQVCRCGCRSIAVHVDQTDYEQVKQAVRDVSQKMGDADILINNAAILGNNALAHKMKIVDWEREVRVNLCGPFYFVKEVMPQMLQQRWGRILNISSIAGIAGSAGQIGYSSTKAALIGLAKTVALEGAHYGITANALCIGPIDSYASHSTTKPDVLERIINSNPMRRLGTLEEVSSMATFMVSDKASFLTGTEVIMDGGQTLFVF